MSKLLKDVVDYLKETQGMSMSKISKDLGKGRNYIREAIERDISMEKQMEILHKLYCRGLGYKDLFAIIQQQSNKYQIAQVYLDEANEENRKLEKHCASLKTTLEHRNKSLSEANRKIKVKEIAIESINRGLNNRQDLYNESQQQRKDLEERLNERSAKNRELEHQIVVLQKKIDEDAKIYLDGKIELDKHNLQLQKELAEEKESCDIGEKQIDRQNETIDGLKNVCKELGIDANNWQKTSKIWKLSFIASSLFLVILAMYHAF